MHRSSSRQSGSLSRDDRAVSEVVGHMLIFLILSTFLVGSLLGFNVAKENATERSVELRGEAIAQGIAARIMDAAIFSEQNDPSENISYEYNFRLPLEWDIEGYSYTVDVEDGWINLIVPGLGAVLEASLFGVEDAIDVEICNSPPLSGGPLHLRAFSITGANASEIPAYCTSSLSGERIIFLEELQ